MSQATGEGRPGRTITTAASEASTAAAAATAASTAVLATATAAVLATSPVAADSSTAVPAADGSLLPASVPTAAAGSSGLTGIHPRWTPADSGTAGESICTGRRVGPGSWRRGAVPRGFSRCRYDFNFEDEI